MRIVWAEIFLSYVIMYGENIIDIDGKRFFETRKQVREWLRPKGLKLSGNKVVIQEVEHDIL